MEYFDVHQLIQSIHIHGILEHLVAVFEDVVRIEQEFEQYTAKEMIEL